MNQNVLISASGGQRTDRPTIPPFEFENRAVIALGGIPNKVQVGDLGVAASRQSAGNFDGIDMAAFCRKPLRQNGLGAP